MNGLQKSSREALRTEFALNIKNDLNIRRLLSGDWELINGTDVLINIQAPWKAREESEENRDKTALSETLYISAESIRILTALLYPFIPEAASKVWQQLGLGAFKDGKTEKWLPGEYEQLLQWGGLKPGTKLGELGPIFPRADKDAIKKMQQLEENNASGPLDPGS